MPKIFIITGVPGTGKTTLLRNLSKNLSNATFESSNKIAKENNLFVDKDSDGSFIINLKNLKESINFFITQHKTSKYIIIEGHLLSDIKITNATVIVLRSHLKVLENRLKKRKYSKKKLSENIFSEAINYCAFNANKNYKDVYELMGSKDEILKSTLKIIKGKKIKKRTYDFINEIKQMAHNKYIWK